MEHTGRLLAAALLTLSTAGPALAAPERGRRPRDTYVLNRGNSASVSGSLEDLGTLRRRYSGDFLWFRRGGTAYVIREAGLLSDADAFFEPLRKLQPDQDDVSRRESALDREDEQVDAEAEAIDAEEETGPSPGLDRRRRALDARRRDLSRRQRELATEERALDRRSDALEEEAERELWKFLDRTVTSGAAHRASGK